MMIQQWRKGHGIHMKELRDLISKYHQEATVFFNATPHLRILSIQEKTVSKACPGHPSLS
jgi:hypothetical protein